jgi:hypothetical protein
MKNIISSSNGWPVQRLRSHTMPVWTSACRAERQVRRVLSLIKDMPFEPGVNHCDGKVIGGAATLSSSWSV